MQIVSTAPTLANLSTIIVTITSIKMPVSTKAFESFVFFTASGTSATALAPIEYAKDGTANSQPNSSITTITAGAAQASVVFVNEENGTGQLLATYQFTFQTVDPIPITVS